jgi:hypothetical protein
MIPGVHPKVGMAVEYEIHNAPKFIYMWDQLTATVAAPKHIQELNPNQ